MNHATHRRFFRRAIAFVVGLIMLGAGGQFAWAEQPETSAQTTIYLPLMNGEDNTTSPPPPPPPTETPAPPAAPGFFAIDGYLTYNATTAIDAQGGAHLAFYVSDEQQEQPLGQPAFYTYCAGGAIVCADPSKWSELVQIDSGVNEVQITVTADGRPRLLIRRNGSRTYDYHYWSCEQQCTNAQSWVGLFITEAAGVELRNTYLPQHSFALDSQGRPRFVWSNGWGNQRRHGLYYASCDAADCTEPGSWQHTLLYTLDNKTVTADYSALLFDGDKPRFLTRVNHSGLPVSLHYFACDSACDSSPNWGASTIAHPEGKMWANWDLVLDGQGRPRVALYEAAGIDITVGGKLFYGWCDSNCSPFIMPSLAEEQFQLVQVAAGEGQSVDMAIDQQGRTHMVYDAGQRGTLGELWCDNSCTSASSWQRRILETSEQLSAQLNPASPLSCDQQDKAWLDAIPQVTFDAQGRMVVAYDITSYARCYSLDPSDPTKRIYSRVERIWWAIRWAQFARA
jgi:hypothetical protein